MTEEIEEFEAISYAIVSDGLSHVANEVKLPIAVKSSIQQGIIPDESKENEIGVNSKILDVLSRVTPDKLDQSGSARVC